MSYTKCSRFKGEHIVYAGYTICTSREHIVYGAFCGSTVPSFSSRYFNKIKRTSRLGRLLALSLEIFLLSAVLHMEGIVNIKTV